MEESVIAEQAIFWCRGNENELHACLKDLRKQRKLNQLMVQFMQHQWQSLHSEEWAKTL